MKNAWRKYLYIVLTCNFLSCSSNQLLDKWETFKQVITYKVAGSVGGVAYLNYSNGNYLEAINIYEYQVDLLQSLIEEENDSCTNRIYQTDYALSLNNLGFLYSNIGEFEKAEKFFLEALEIKESILGKQHTDYALSLNNLGSYYSDISNYPEAEKYYLEALEIYRSIIGTNHLDYVIPLNNLASLYSDAGNYIKAEKYHLEALEIRKATLGTNHPDYATSLSNLGVHYSNIGNYTKAEKYYLEALEIRKSILGTNHLDYALSLNNLGSYYSDIGNYPEAEKYYLEALEIYRSIIGTNHLDYAISLNNLASLYSDIGNYIKAEKYYLEALEIRKTTLGTNHPDYATSLSNLGSHYSDIGNYTKAKSCYLEVLKIRKSALGTNHPEYVGSLNNLGALDSKIGNYVEAGKYYLEALNVGKQALGHTHPDYAILLNNVGVYYLKTGNYSIAEKYCLQALEVKESILGKQHPDYALSLDNLGTHYSQIGNYLEAEKYHLEALEIRKSTLGEHHPDYALSLDNLGTHYSQIGNYLEAEKYHLEALKIRKSTLGGNHPDCALSLSNLSTLYSDMGNYAEAEKFCLEALKIRKTTLGINHPYYAASLNNLGTLQSNMNNYAEAVKSCLKALEIQKTTLGTNHPDYATSLNNLGVLYSNNGNHVEAEKCYLSALEVRKLTIGMNHPDYAGSLRNLAIHYDVIGNYEEAYTQISLSAQLQKKSFLPSLKYMTEQQRELYWKTMQPQFDSMYPTFSYRHYFSTPSISTFAYDNELFKKGLLLSSSNTIRQSILGSNDSILIKQWNELVGIKQVIMNLEEKEPTSTNLVHYKNQADSLEKIVTKSSAIFRETKKQQSITWDSIQQYLNPDEVAIEYFIAPLNEDSTMYCALLLRHDSQYPELIPLCEEKEIVNCLSHNQTNDIYTFDTNSKTIFNLIWDKILPQIHEGETIYFSPAGLLHQIAIENIPYDQTHTMFDVYTMVRLSSTREIVKEDKNIKHHTATIYGGIFYDIDKTSLLAESRNYDTEDMFTYRSISSTLQNRGSVLYLPGTKQEAESIYSLLNSNNITSTLYTASKANEESFKSLSGKHRNILHIGTHGFYWEDSTARKQDYFSQRIQLQMLGDNQLQKPSIDPLTRCGLLFAGSNIALSGHSNDLPEGVQDGILTAKEISLMDLRDADLVVLSACETAKGDITSEGIFGLQRAFKMAGVQTIIMSLWKVNDQATQMLMTEFYTNWISKNQSKREAFKNAQNTVRAKFEEPEYWAGFILLD